MRNTVLPVGTELYSKPLELIHLEKQSLCPLISNSAYSISPDPGNHHFTLWVYDFDCCRQLACLESCSCLSFCAYFAYFTYCKVFKVHPGCHACKISFFFKAKEYSIVYLYYILFIHSSVDEPSDYFILAKLWTKLQYI